MFKNNVQKVWKSTIAYLVGSIAFIQLAPVFFATFPPEEMFGSSAEEIMPFLFILVALGFPLIIGLSFYFNQQNVKESNPIKQTKKDYKQKIAVIPFANLNKDDDGAFLVDGIVEDLITEFSMISEIEIVSRQTCFNLREENLSHDVAYNRSMAYIIASTIFNHYIKGIENPNAKHIAFIWNGGGSAWKRVDNPKKDRKQKMLDSYWKKVKLHL